MLSLLFDFIALPLALLVAFPFVAIFAFFGKESYRKNFSVMMGTVSELLRSVL